MTKARKHVDWELEAEKWERAYRIAQASRQRVVHAYLALRDVKTMAPYPEPAIRKLHLALLNLPSRVAEDLAHEDAETAERLLMLEVWRILDEFDERLTAGDRGPLTPANARYLARSNELRNGDLKLE